MFWNISEKLSGFGRLPRLIPALAAAFAIIAGTANAQQSDNAQERHKVTFVTGNISLTFAPFAAAMALDTFKDNGIDFELKTVPISATVGALLSGEADIATIGVSTALNAIEQGGDISFVAGLTTSVSILGLRPDVVKKLEAKGVTPTSPTADRVNALKGLTLIGPQEGSANMINLRAALAAYKVPAEDVKVLPGDPAAVVASVRQGVVDGGMWGIGVLEQNFADGSAVPWINWASNDLPELKDLAFGGMIASNKYIADNPKVVEALTKSLADAGKIMHDDPEKAKAAVKAKWFPDMKQDVWDLSWNIASGAFVLDGTMSRKSFDEAVTVLGTVGGSTFTKTKYETAVADNARHD